MRKIANTLHEGARQPFDLRGDILHSDARQQIERRPGNINIRHRRRAAFKAPGIRRGIQTLGIERESVALRDPTGDGRRERFDQLPPHIQEAQTRRAQQIFERAGDEEIHVQRFHIQRAGSAILIAIEKNQSAMGVGDFAIAATSDRNPLTKETCVSGTMRVRSSMARS